jgi:hypothetical protein
LEKNGSVMGECMLFLDFKEAYSSVSGEVFYNILIENFIRVDYFVQLKYVYMNLWQIPLE